MNVGEEVGLDAIVASIIDDFGIDQAENMRALAGFILRDPSPGEMIDVLVEARVLFHAAFGITNGRDARKLFEITMRWANADVILALAYAIKHVIPQDENQETIYS
jgi:hypothetical protein